MTSKTQTTGYIQARKMFTMLIIGIVLSFVLYSYAIASTTLTISSTKAMNHDIGELQTEIAELELKYYEMVNSISIDEAESFGFTETKKVEYARIDHATSVAYNL